MKKRVMLVMAIVMVLGSVKAMAADEMMENESMIENALTKTDAAEADQVRSQMMGKIRMQIITLAGETQFSDEVKVGSEVVSRGQALFAAEADFESLNKSFDLKHAEEVSKILEDSIKSVKQK